MKDLTTLQHARAAREGWGVFNGSEIQRDDDNPKFRSDYEAVRFISKRAKAGSKFHQKVAKLFLS